MNRQMPNNVEAEKQVLGSIFLNNDSICDAIELLKPEDFYNGSNKILYETMIEMYKNNTPIDPVTISNTLGIEGIKAVGGVTYITTLCSNVLSTSNLKTYIEIVKEKADRRKIITACAEALENAYGDKVVKELIIGIEDNLLDIGVSKSEKVLTDKELMDKTLNMVQRNYELGGEIPGISTGYKSLDRATGGLMKGDAMVIAGRPSMGKTCLALNIGGNVAKDNKVAIFELEMSAEKLGARRLASSALINATRLPRGDMDEKEWLKLSNVAGIIAEKNNMFTDTTPGITMAEIRAKCKKIKIKYGLDVVIIDHIGLITPSNPKESRVQQISEITRQGKILAKDLDACVIMLSQLSRAVETRADKRPMLSDLRDSGSIEQDADLVMFVYRDAYYNPESEDKGIMETIIAKQRDGRTGTLKFAYMDQYQRVSELDIRG